MIKKLSQEINLGMRKQEDHQLDKQETGSESRMMLHAKRLKVPLYFSVTRRRKHILKKLRIKQEAKRHKIQHEIDDDDDSDFDSDSERDDILSIQTDDPFEIYITDT